MPGNSAVELPGRRDPPNNVYSRPIKFGPHHYDLRLLRHNPHKGVDRECVRHQHKRAWPAPVGHHLLQHGKTLRAPVGRGHRHHTFDGTESHEPRRFQAAAQRRGKDLVYGYAVLTESLADSSGLPAPMLIHITLGRTVVDLESGWIAVAWRRTAVADQRNVTPVH